MAKHVSSLVLFCFTHHVICYLDVLKIRYNVVIYSDSDIAENSWESRVVQFLVVSVFSLLL